MEPSELLGENILRDLRHSSARNLWDAALVRGMDDPARANIAVRSGLWMGAGINNWSSCKFLRVLREEIFEHEGPVQHGEEFERLMGVSSRRCTTRRDHTYRQAVSAVLNAFSGHTACD